MTKKPVKGAFRIRRDLRRWGLGMLQISSHTRNKLQFERRNGVVSKLIDDAQVTVLAALQAGRVSIEQLVDLDRQNDLKGSAILGSIALRSPLWSSWELQDARQDAAKPTVKRYKVSRLQLKQHAAEWLTEDAKVGDLLGVDWPVLANRWPGSPSDWMNLRRSVSAFLSRHLGDKFHPFRRSIVQKIPTKKERKRVPDLTPAAFWRIMKHARADVRPVYVALVATGMRVRSEFLECKETDLLPATKQVRVPLDPVAGQRYVAVEPELWKWVTAAIPSPVAYKRLRELWITACKKAEIEGITLHDLRHCHGQWATDFGATLQDVQVSLGHTTLHMASRYAAQKSARQSASGVAKALKKAGGRRR